MARSGDGIYLRGETWWLDCRIRGKRHRLSLGKGISKSAAKEISIVKKAALLRGFAGTMMDLLLESDCHARFAVFSGQALKRIKGPIVYIFVRHGRIKYIGKSDNGIVRPLARQHHILGEISIENDDALVYFPVISNDEASNLESQLIDLLKPEWNDGNAPNNEPATEEDMRKAVNVVEAALDLSKWAQSVITP